MVNLQPDLRDTEGEWFYWCFRVCGAEGRTLTFRFPKPHLIGVHGPAISRDKGKTWQWAGQTSPEQTAFSYPFDQGASDVRFAVGMPYVLTNLEVWLGRWRETPRLERKILCHTRSDAAVPLLRIKPADSIRHRVLLTTRHHCCEAMASYVLEGALDASLEDPSVAPGVEIVAVPMVDLDGVQAGDQGKNRRPHDHNRDYMPTGIYPETRAIRELVTKAGDPPFSIAFDLHCPGLMGRYNQAIYQVGARDTGVWERQQRFGRILEQCHDGVLPYQVRDDLPFGVAWNCESNESAGVSCSRWMAEAGGVPLASSLEIPYADV